LPPCSAKPSETTWKALYTVLAEQQRSRREPWIVQ
jgi:hypothetical protein